MTQNHLKGRTRALILAALVTASPFAMSPVSRAADAPAHDADKAHAGSCDAAVQYWQGFALLPTLDDRQKHIEEEWNTVELDPAAEDVIHRSDRALLQLHRGAMCDHCDWGLHTEDGFGLLLPHLAKGREMARLACLRARYEFGHGNAVGAIQDVMDTMVLGRRAGQDSILIALLVQDSMEEMGIAALAPHLKGLNAAQLATIADRLEHLPAGGELRESVNVERHFGLDWLESHVKNDLARQSGATWDRSVAGLLGVSTDKAHELVPSPQSMLGQLEKTRPLYDQMAKAVTLPADQLHARMTEIHDEADQIPIAKLLIPAMNRAYDKDAAARTRVAMLRAAVAILRNGPDQAKQFTDPSTGQAFGFKQLPGGGFELTSSLTTTEGKPVTLTIPAMAKEHEAARQ